jgi:NADPH:quinone reductase-like Zn-dependent oxidoreductase
MTNKAIRFVAFGGPEVVRYEDIERPTPGEGEALIRVAAAGVNPIDWKAREGYMKGFIDYQPPFTPGMELSGVVEALGPGASGVAVGDEVFGGTAMQQAGAYAQYAVAPASGLAAKPRSLDLASAAALPVAAATAWSALFRPDYGDLKPGQTVLIHAAAGGVGVIAVQLAKHHGAKVIATASTGNVDFLKQLGADQVIDYRTQRFDEIAKDVDLVFDLIGGEVTARSWRTLKPGGVLASAVGQPADAGAESAGKRGVAIYGIGDGALLAKVAALVDRGVVKVVVSETMPLADAGAALEKSKGGHVRGKILLTP